MILFYLHSIVEKRWWNVDIDHMDYEMYQLLNKMN